jgi:hypothetical protein
MASYSVRIDFWSRKTIFTNLIKVLEHYYSKLFLQFNNIRYKAFISYEFNPRIFLWQSWIKNDYNFRKDSVIKEQETVLYLLPFLN